MKKLFIILVVCFLVNKSVSAQGCVAIRGAGGATCSMLDHMKNIDTEFVFFENDLNLSE
jgi:hypothetical protein